MSGSNITSQDMYRLVARAKAGDQQALSTLYEVSYKGTYYTIKSMIKEEPDLLDILQDSYIKAFGHLDQLSDGSKFLTWMRQIAANTARDWLKKKRPALFTDLETDTQNTPVEERFVDRDTQDFPHESLDRKETQRLLREILDGLPEDQRVVIGMYYYHELSVKTIAAQLGVSESAVKSRLLYGRKRIEIKVLELEKQGTKLYGLAPLPFLLWLLRGQHTAPAPRADVWEHILQQLSSSAAPATQPQDRAVHTASSSRLAAASGGTATTSAVGKSLACLGAAKLGALAVVAVAVIGLIGYSVHQTQQAGTSQVAETAVATEVPANDVQSSSAPTKVPAHTASPTAATPAEADIDKALTAYTALLQDPLLPDRLADNDTPTGNYLYTLLMLQPEDTVPTLLVEQETTEFINYLTVFQYQPDDDSVLQADGTLAEGASSIGGFRGGISQYRDGNGLCVMEISSGTGATTVYRVTLENGALVRSETWSGRMDLMPDNIATREIVWHALPDLTLLESWTPDSPTADEQLPVESTPTETNLPKDGSRPVLTGTYNVYPYEDVLALQGEPDPNAPWGGHSDSYTLIVLDTPQRLELQSVDGLRTDDAWCFVVYDTAPLAGCEGQHIAFSVDPEKSFWPSDASLPLGQPSAGDLHVLS